VEKSPKNQKYFYDIEIRKTLFTSGKESGIQFLSNLQNSIKELS